MTCLEVEIVSPFPCLCFGFLWGDFFLSVRVFGILFLQVSLSVLWKES